MTRAQRKEIGDYALSVGLAVFFSIPICAGLPFFVHVALPLKVVLWGVPFGSAIYFARMIQSKVTHRSFLLTILAHSVLMLLCIGLSFGLAFFFLVAADNRESPLTPNVVSTVVTIMSSKGVQLAAFGSFLGVLVVSSIFQISRKLGPGVLRNWLLGKYHEPREEERIFVFLDMKDSTTLAEKLGALKFSALVRDFFSDLTEPIIESKAEVSHYIGDEAVLSWIPKDGLDKGNCLRLFFLFEERLARRSKHYLERYGMVPGFKAGAHIGPVVATEVGDLKSEIVYHGDVLNTAARIQSMCSALEESFLISGDLRARLPEKAPYHLESKGRHLLKGKEHDVEIYAVLSSNRAGQTPKPALEGVTA